MTIERVIDGKIYEFPAGTPEATIRRFTLNKAGTPDSPATAPAAPVRPQAPRPNAMLPGAAGQALQGLSMGFSDEAIARLRSMGGNQSYEDLVKAEREGLRKYAEENPRTAVASELGGALVPALFTGGAGAVPSVSKAVGPKLAGMLFGKAPSIPRMMGYGAGSGAVTAVGTSEKPPGELGGEAVKGATVGAVTTGTLGLLGKYVAMPAFSKIKQSLGFGDANKAADLAIVKALEKDGMTPDQALAKMQAMSRGEITLADLGENTAALLRNATAAPSPARRIGKSELVNREMERIPRVSEDLRTLMSGSKDFYTDVLDLIKKRKDEADPLYKAAYAGAPTFSPATAPDIARLRNLPTFKEAMKIGAKRMADNEIDITDPRNTLRGLHETKIALDDMIENAMREGSGGQAATLLNMKRRLLADMEKASPEYKIARQTFAGDSELLTAMKEGQQIYTMPELDMRKLIDRFKDSPSEYDAFRSGISQAMLEKLRVAGPTADPVKSILSRDAEQKLRRAFRDDAAFDEFKDRLMQEQRMLQTEKAGFRRTPLDTDLDQGAAGVGAAANLMAGRPFTAAGDALRAQFPNMIGMPPRVARQTTQKLLTPTAKVDTVIDSIMQSLKQQEESLLTSSRATNAGATLIGGLAASRDPKDQYPEDSMAPTRPPRVELSGMATPPAGPPPSPLSSMGQ
jgi:hypothetical protein